MLLFTFVGQVTASAVMSCEMSGTIIKKQNTVDISVQHAKHGLNMLSSETTNSTMNHDCCDDEASESSDHCGGKCQCLIGGCSLVYIESVKAFNDAFIFAERIIVKYSPSPRTPFLSFLYRPPIV